MLLHHGDAYDEYENEDGHDQCADDVRHHADEIVAEERAQGDLNHYQDQGSFWQRRAAGANLCRAGRRAGCCQLFDVPTAIATTSARLERR